MGIMLLRRPVFQVRRALLLLLLLRVLLLLLLLGVAVVVVAAVVAAVVAVVVVVVVLLLLLLLLQPLLRCRLLTLPLPGQHRHAVRSREWRGLLVLRRQGIQFT